MNSAAKILFYATALLPLGALANESTSRLCVNNLCQELTVNIPAYESAALRELVMQYTFPELNLPETGNNFDQLDQWVEESLIDDLNIEPEEGNVDATSATATSIEITWSNAESHQGYTQMKKTIILRDEKDEGRTFVQDQYYVFKDNQKVSIHNLLAENNADVKEYEGMLHSALINTYMPQHFDIVPHDAVLMLKDYANLNWRLPIADNWYFNHGKLIISYDTGTILPPKFCRINIGVSPEESAEFFSAEVLEAAAAFSEFDNEDNCREYSE